MKRDRRYKLHLVNEECDGRPILQKGLAVEPGDTPETLQKRVSVVEAEWQLLPKALAMVCSDEV